MLAMDNECWQEYRAYHQPTPQPPQPPVPSLDQAGLPVTTPPSAAAAAAAVPSAAAAAAPAVTATAPHLQPGAGAYAGYTGPMAPLAAMVPMTVEDASTESAWGSAAFPKGMYDHSEQQIDLRTTNSWRLKIDEVSTPEVAEAFTINSMAPFVLNGKLIPLMRESTPIPEVT